MPRKVIHLSFKNGNFMIAWVKPQGFRKIMYADNKLEAKVWHPRLLFRSDGTGLEVYALGPGRVTEKTIVYEAPYDNIGTGQLCFGNVPRPRKITDINEFINGMERAFTFGQFTHNKFLKDWQQRAKSLKKVDVTKLVIHGTFTDIING